MLVWIISIAVVIVFAVTVRYIMWYATGLVKGTNKGAREVCSGFSGMSVGALGVIFILFSMVNSCTSRYTTYEDCMESSWMYYLIFSLIIIGCFVLWFLHDTNKVRKNKDKEDRLYLEKFGLTKEEYEKEQYRKELQARKTERQKFEKLRNELEDKYGTVSFSTKFSSPQSRNQYTMNVYEKGGLVLVLSGAEIKDTIPFPCILDYSVDDEVTSISPDRATTTSKVSTGSMLARGLVGGVIFGEAGAIVGATTSKRTAETMIEKGESKHQYSISINLNSISHPIFIMNFGSDLKKCKKTAGVLSVIINRNKTINPSDDSLELSISQEDETAKNHMDYLLKDVARMAVANGSISAPMIERRYEISYTRALSILNQMEALGLVGPSLGGTPRKVLVDSFQLENMFEE